MIRRGLLALVVVVSWVSGARAQSDLVKRGDYLVNGLLTCGNCHTPKGPSGDIMDKAFSGGLSWDEPPFKVTAPNITPDKESGIGKYTDDELKQLLRKGIKRDGKRVAMVMPSGFYEVMTDRDLEAVIAYLRTLKPIKNAVPDPIYKMEQGHPIPPGGERPYSESMLSDRLKRGFYLTTIAHCMECHTPMGQRGRDFGGKLGAGGAEFPGPWGVSVSRNITSSKTSGIGGWTDEDIKRAITRGISKDGRKLSPPMGYGYYANISAVDLNAIIAYLRTVPPID
ncbi:MAG: c-type cytochrome [Bosea sp.]|uniref:c-type cytochrome n=1 Tax=unclassified Bosea (in: a-proteobacteria) TaxID=2653178 RepID=UPI00095E8EDF|nr:MULTISPECIES: c-type cytochrome [unclassified Bosea (in: a-proteobacteria)]MBN9458155.1 c-type cytochrome [Bosea sp. (in: a-proteobacteria)]OJV07090.1 MAG: phosphomannomutase [Bosea sp. 67-29]